MSQIISGTFSLASPGAPRLTRTTDGFEQVTFPSPFPRGVTPVVVVTNQTFNGTDTPGLRIQNVTNTGFLARNNELVAFKGRRVALSDGNHIAETIGYIAMG